MVSEYSTDPVWSPDGRFLVYSGADVGTTFPLLALSAASPDGTAEDLWCERELFVVRLPAVVSGAIPSQGVEPASPARGRRSSATLPATLVRRRGERCAADRAAAATAQPPPAGPTRRRR